MAQRPLLTVAIDGPAASGKGTLARRIADHFGLNHLDTGLTYRAVAETMLETGAALDDQAAAIAIANGLDLGALDKQRLSRHGIGDAASRIATMPGVRAVLVAAQRRFADRPPGAVLDGRDIGTVVCPDADAKLFVTAGAAVRARRRADEMRDRGLPADEKAILADLERRDARDSARAASPLEPAVDAHLLDTSEMTIEAAFRAALAIVEGASARLAGNSDQNRRDRP
jgi:cytidylate kinase